jgi:hypothetical protein
MAAVGAWSEWLESFCAKGNNYGGAEAHFEFAVIRAAVFAVQGPTGRFGR